MEPKIIIATIWMSVTREWPSIACSQALAESSVEWASGEVERENVPLDLIGLLWRGLLGYDLQEFDLEH